jgi:Glycosyl hydrolase family 26
MERSKTIWRWATSGFMAFLVAFAVLAAGAAPAASAAMKLGVYYCPTSPVHTLCLPSNGLALDAYKEEFGRYPAISMNYRSLDEPLLSESEMADQQARGVEPMVTVEPYVGGYGNAVSLASLASGSYDSYIRAEANVAKSYDGEILVRFAHEMNGSWEPWGPGHGSTAQDYINAWRHYVSVFREDGATNVRFVWSPNVDGGSYPFSPYFPGDEWVDYVALDGYNWGSGGTNSWQTFAQVFSSSYQTLTQLSSKPVMIAETASSEVGGDKAAWIREAFLHTIPQQFPRVAAVVWFDRDFSAVGEQDWRINSSSAAAAAYGEAVSNSLYGGSDPAPSTESAAPSPSIGGSSNKPRRRSATVRLLRVAAPGDVARRKQGQASGAAVPSNPRMRLTKIVYRLSRAAPVSISVERGHGRRVATTTIRRSTSRGAIRLSRLVRGRLLRRGGYRVVARTLDDGGTSAKTRRFKVI